jgi:hypothetical protein
LGKKRKGDKIYRIGNKKRRVLNEGALLRKEEKI